MFCYCFKKFYLSLRADLERIKKSTRNDKNADFSNDKVIFSSIANGDSTLPPPLRRGLGGGFFDIPLPSLRASRKTCVAIYDCRLQKSVFGNLCVWIATNIRF